MSVNHACHPDVGSSGAASNDQREFPEVERAWMVIDLVNSTSWYLSWDELTSFALLRTCIEQMTAAVEDHRGEVIRLSGDGLHASFENPADALSSAIAYQSSMATVDNHPHRLFPSARIGLSFGPCIRCQVRDFVEYHGCAVIIATRLAQCSDCEGILMSETFKSDRNVARALEPVHVDVQLQVLKGFPAPLKVYHLANTALLTMQDHSNKDYTAEPEQAR